MEIILIILTSSVISGLMWLAYNMGKSSQTNEGLTVTKYNQQAIKDMNEWRNFTGGR